MRGRGTPALSKRTLEALYARYNVRRCVHPDPVEFLYHYKSPRDREIVGILASSLAYGRVVQILRSVSRALERLGPSPCHVLMHSSESSLYRRFTGFKHRFTTGEDVAALLVGVKKVLEYYGSLNHCFLEALNQEERTVLPALSHLVKEIVRASARGGSTLLPSPGAGSACKRLNLFLRWMVRRDEVDPGCWEDVPASKLIIPLDTHMHRIGLALGLTRRTHADMRTALEITEGFRVLAPDDPVRYDFALTRLGIKGDRLLSCSIAGMFSDHRNVRRP